MAREEGVNIMAIDRGPAIEPEPATDRLRPPQASEAYPPLSKAPHQGGGGLAQHALGPNAEELQQSSPPAVRFPLLEKQRAIVVLPYADAGSRGPAMTRLADPPALELEH